MTDGEQLVLKLILSIFIIPIIILGTFLIFNAIPFPQSLETIKNQIAAAASGIISFVYLIIILIYTVSTFRKAGKAFEDTFLKLNLEPVSFRLFGRQYKGFINSRSVTIEYFPPRGIHRSILNIYLSISIDPDHTTNKKTPVFSNRKINDFNSYSENIDTKKLVKDKRFRSCLDLILSNGDERNLKKVYLLHDKIWFRMVLSDISEKSLLDLITNLLALAEKIEYLRKER